VIPCSKKGHHRPRQLKINLQKLARFSRLKIWRPKHHLHHASHHSFTTISPPENTTKSKNPQQKQRFWRANLSPQKSNSRASFAQLSAVTVDRGQRETFMLTRKLYYLTRHPEPRIRPMPASLVPRVKSLISLWKSPVKALAVLSILLATPLIHARDIKSPAANLTVAEQYLLAAANEDRANQGLSPLRFDPTLAEASSIHAREMADHQEISHQFDGEPELAARGANAGAHFSLITENVGEAPTSVIIHNLWMHSPGHRANLLDPNVDSIGIAIVTRDNQLYAVEDFASTVETISLNQQERTVADVIARSGIRIAETTNDARETCTMTTGYAGSRQPWFIMRYTAGSLNEIPNQLKSKLTSGKYHRAVVGACAVTRNSPFTAYNIAVLLYP
jgi:uncharacterized protein YkwD